MKCSQVSAFLRASPNPTFHRRAKRVRCKGLLGGRLPQQCSWCVTAVDLLSVDMDGLGETGLIDDVCNQDWCCEVCGPILWRGEPCAELAVSRQIRQEV